MEIQLLLSPEDIGSLDEFDVCIVGTGPAGISCALTVAKTENRVLLLEAGDWDFTDESQDIYLGEIIGDPYGEDLSLWRLRYFGGTSNHWAGFCRPLDPWDFLPKGRSVLGWPISKADLDPFSARARELLDLPEFEPDTAFGTSGLSKIHFSYSPPTRFAEKFRDEIESSRRIFLSINTSLCRFETNGSAISGAVVRLPSGEERRVRAKNYVLATGGIENSRLLLWSNATSNNQIVKSPVLGQYYMDHPDFFIGEALIAEEVGLRFDQENLAFLAPSFSTMNANGSLSCSLRIIPTSYRGTKQMIVDVGCVAPNVGRWALSLFDRELICGYKMTAVWEQEPVAGNHIRLSTELDGQGIPRVRLFWSKSDYDRRTARVAAEQLGNYLAANDLGRVRLVDWVTDNSLPFPDDVFVGHHLGGTRMASNEYQGVVDKDCKVFGSQNLFVAGSSLFPSGGHANPTFTIVQLAIRLGVHLTSKV